MLVTFRHFDGRVKVNFPMLAAAAGDIDECVRAMDISLADLNTSLDTKLADWEGGAYGNYEQTKTMWMNAAGEIKILLDSIRRGVESANERMTMTELANAARLTRG